MAAAVFAVSAVLTACGGVTEEQLEARTSAIAMMEAGDYEGAVTALNDLVEEATSVTEFELDILKYRAEAEFLLEDYAAAVHTYQTLMEVDAKKPEYCYLSAFALAYDGKLEEAWGTGTAAVVSPIGYLFIDGVEYKINDNKIGPVTQKLYDNLTSIQWGKIKDEKGWTVEV